MINRSTNKKFRYIIGSNNTVDSFYQTLEKAASIEKPQRILYLFSNGFLEPPILDILIKKMANSRCLYFYWNEENPNVSNKQNQANYIFKELEANNVNTFRIYPIETLQQAIKQVGKYYDERFLICICCNQVKEAEKLLVSSFDKKEPESLWQPDELAKITSGQWLNFSTYKYPINYVNYNVFRYRPGILAITTSEQHWGKRVAGNYPLMDKFDLFGASAVIAEKEFLTKPVESYDFPILLVDNSYQAMKDLAHAAREKFKGTTICISGSVGKTTTTRLIKELCTSLGRTYATAENNNHFRGVHLTYASLPKDCDYCVIEASAGGPKETLPKAQLIQPNIFVMTEITHDHVKHYPTPQKTAEQKSIYIDEIQADGIVIINRDMSTYAIVNERAQKSKAKQIISFGHHQQADIKLLSHQATQHGFSCLIQIFEQKITLQLPVFSLGHVDNYLASIAVYYCLSGDNQHLSKIFNQIQPNMYLRFNIQKTKIKNAYFYLIEDIFNANPASIKSAFDSLISFPLQPNAKKILVISHIMGMGKESKIVHRNIATHIMQSKIDRVFTVGPNMSQLRAVIAPPILAAHSETSTEIINCLMSEIHENDVVLLKGSFTTKEDHVLSDFIEILRKAECFHLRYNFGDNKNSQPLLWKQKDLAEYLNATWKNSSDLYPITQIKTLQEQNLAGALAIIPHKQLKEINEINLLQQNITAVLTDAPSDNITNIPIMTINNISDSLKQLALKARELLTGKLIIVIDKAEALSIIKQQISYLMNRQSCLYNIQLNESNSEQFHLSFSNIPRDIPFVIVYITAPLKAKKQEHIYQLIKELSPDLIIFDKQQFEKKLPTQIKHSESYTSIKESAKISLVDVLKGENFSRVSIEINNKKHFYYASKQSNLWVTTSLISLALINKLAHGSEHGIKQKHDTINVEQAIHDLSYCPSLSVS